MLTFDRQSSGEYGTNDIASTVSARDFKSASDLVLVGDELPSDLAVRRITPKEAERLQALPDDWTKIVWRKKSPDTCPDGPRYKAVGNGQTVTVMEWLANRMRKGMEAKE